jgi:hypothetical protein
MRNSRRYRHRFTALTDLLVSPYNLGFCIYNWGFTVLGGRKHDAFRRHVIEMAELRGDEEILDAGCGDNAAHRGAVSRVQGVRHRPIAQDD